MLTCTLDVSKVESATIIWHLQTGGRAIASGLHVLPGANTIAMVEVQYPGRSIKDFNANTFHRYLRDDYMPEAPLSNHIACRILSRKHQAEIYIDDIWAFSMDMSDLPAAGEMGFLCSSGALDVTNVKVFELEAL